MLSINHELAAAEWVCGGMPLRGPISTAPPAAPPSTPPAPAGDDVAVHTARALMAAGAALGCPADVAPWWMRAWGFRAEGRGTTLLCDEDITQLAKRKPEVRVLYCVGLMLDHGADILVVAAPSPRRGRLTPRVMIAGRHLHGLPQVMRGDVAPRGGWRWEAETGRRGEPLPMLVSTSVATARRRLARAG